MPEPILGIPCGIPSRKVREAVDTVLAAIARHPRDWARLRRRIRSFEFVEGEARPGVQGEWVVDANEVREFYRDQMRRFEAGIQNAVGEARFHVRGVVLLARDAVGMDPRNLVGLVAHECGHVATRERDFEARQRVFSDREWSSELCADKYAYRWGFEQAIRASAKTRCFAHHCVLPGETIELDGAMLRVDRNFFVRPVRRD